MDGVQKTFVFTGVLSSMKRAEAIHAVEEIRGIVQANVTAKTNYLVVGHKQLDMFNPEKISRKRELADKLIEKGYSIKVLREAEFLKMIGKSNS